MEQAGKFKLVPSTHLEELPVARSSKEIQHHQDQFVAFHEIAYWEDSDWGWPIFPWEKAPAQDHDTIL